jgi:hypothetical protein
MTKPLSEQHADALKAFTSKIKPHPDANKLEGNNFDQLEIVRMYQLLVLLQTVEEKMRAHDSLLCKKVTNRPEFQQLCIQINYVIEALQRGLRRQGIKFDSPCLNTTKKYQAIIDKLDNPVHLISHFYNLIMIANTWRLKTFVLMTPSHRLTDSSHADALHEMSNNLMSKLLNSISVTSKGKIKFTLEQEADFLNESTIAFNQLNKIFYDCTNWCLQQPITPTPRQDSVSRQALKSVGCFTPAVAIAFAVECAAALAAEHFATPPPTRARL